jgi:hypothetical protein
MPKPFNAKPDDGPVWSWDVQPRFDVINAPAGPPERRRSAVAHLRRQDQLHGDRLGDDPRSMGLYCIRYEAPEHTAGLEAAARRRINSEELRAKEDVLLHG